MSAKCSNGNQKHQYVLLQCSAENTSSFLDPQDCREKLNRNQDDTTFFLVTCTLAIWKFANSHEIHKTNVKVTKKTGSQVIVVLIKRQEQSFGFLLACEGVRSFYRVCTGYLWPVCLYLCRDFRFELSFNATVMKCLFRCRHYSDSYYVSDISQNVIIRLVHDSTRVSTVHVTNTSAPVSVFKSSCQLSLRLHKCQESELGTTPPKGSKTPFFSSTLSKGKAAPAQLTFQHKQAKNESAISTKNSSFLTKLHRKLSCLQINFIALDWLSESLYLSDRDNGRITTCNSLKRDTCTDLIPDLDQPMGVAVYPQLGWVIFSRVFSHALLLARRKTTMAAILVNKEWSDVKNVASSGCFRPFWRFHILNTPPPCKSYESRNVVLNGKNFWGPFWEEHKNNNEQGMTQCYQAFLVYQRVFHSFLLCCQAEVFHLFHQSHIVEFVRRLRCWDSSLVDRTTLLFSSFHLSLWYVSCRFWCELFLPPFCSWLFWTSQGSQPRVERSRLDGSGRQTIVSDAVAPTGITIDHQ